MIAAMGSMTLSSYTSAWDSLSSQKMIRRLLTYSLRIATVLLVLFFAGVAALLYTEPGRTWLAETGMAAAASRLDYELTWRGIHSPSANSWTIDELTLRQGNSLDVSLSGIKLHWWPGTVLAGRIILDEIDIERLSINKLGPAGGSAAGTQQALPVTVHAFSVGTLALNPPAVANTQRYRLDGDLQLFSQDLLLKGNTVVTPADQRSFKLRVSATVKQDMSGSVSGRYDEQRGGAVSTLLKLPEDEPFASSYQADFSQTASGFNVNLRGLAFNFHEHNIAMRGQLQKNGGLYSLDPLHILLDDSEQLLTGTIDGNELNLQLALDGLPLEVVSPWTGRSLPGAADGQLAIRGTSNAPHVSGNLNATTRYKSVSLSISLTAAATPDQLTLQQATVSTEDGAVSTAGAVVNLSDNTMNIQAELNNISMNLLKQLVPSIPAELAGKINGRLGLNGPWQTPAIDFTGGYKGSYRNSIPVAIDVSATGKPYKAEKAAPVQADYEATISRFDMQIEDHAVSGESHALIATEPFVVTIDNTRVRLAGSSHDVSGKIKGDNLALNLSLKDFPLDVISPVIDKPLSGTASAKVFVGGTFSEPLLTGSLDSNLAYRNVPLRVQSEFDASSSWIELRQLKISNDQTDISAEGMLDLVNDDNDLAVNINDIDTATLAGLGLTLPDKLQGRIHSEVTVKGSKRLPVISGEAHFAGTWQDVSVAMLLTGGGSQDRFSIDELEVNAGDDGSLLLHGNYRNRQADFSLEARNLPTALLRRGDWQPPDGVLAANFTLQGSVEQPRADGKLVYAPLPPAGDTAATQTGLEADVKLGGNRLDTRLTLTGDNVPTGTIEVSIPWRRYLKTRTDQPEGPFPLFGSLKAQASLEEICMFLLDTDIHRCRGALQADLSLGGTYTLPELDGRMTVTDGFYENLQSGTNLHDLQMDIQAKGRQLQIIKATATDGEQGQLELSGNGQWRNTLQDDDINLLLKVNNSHVLRRYDMDGIANGMLTLTGDHRELFLSGTLMFQPFTLAMQSLLQHEEIPTLNVVDEEQQRRDTASRQKRQMLPVIHMNVDLTADQQAFLRGPGLEAELAGKLQIQGTYSDPLFRGHFKTVRGSVRIFGKRFILNNGELRLDDEVISMLIPATYTGKDLEVRAELSGTLDDLHLALSSTPTYPEDEIISQLLFGKSTQNISPLQAIRLANAITTFKRGGRPLFDPLGKLEKALSVDRLTVEDNGNSNGVQLGVGKYINEKVYVEMETGTGAGQGWQGNVEVELLPNLNLENTINSESGLGNIGINWKKDY